MPLPSMDDAHRLLRDARKLGGGARDQWSQAATRFDAVRGDVATTWRDGVKRAEPAIERSSVALLRTFQVVVAMLIAIPALIAKSLRIARITARQIEDSLDRGQTLYGQARDRTDNVREQLLTAAHALPRSRRDTRMQRFTTASWLVGGFGAGVAVGWFAHDLRQRRLQAAVDEQARLHAQHVAELDAADLAELSDGTAATLADEIAPAQAAE